jgi:hypothetical protein
MNLRLSPGFASSEPGRMEQSCTGGAPYPPRFPVRNYELRRLIQAGFECTKGDGGG